jgi:DNA-binding transcriptional LysR family regulator
MAQAQPALHALQQATTSVMKDDGAARGRIRVSVPYDLGVARCTAVVEAFLTHHPDIEVELFLADRQVDLIGEGFDAAVRVGILQDKSIVAKKIGSIDGHLIASPSYLLRRGGPSRPADLVHHDCIVFNSPPFDATWRLTGPGRETAEVEVHARLTANALPVVLRAALAGVGIARLPTYALADAFANKRLVRVLPDWSTGERPVFVVFAAAARRPERVRAFVDFVVKNGAMLT